MPLASRDATYASCEMQMAAELVLDQARAQQSRPVETYPSTRASRSRTNIPILIRAAIAIVHVAAEVLAFTRKKRM